VKAYYLIDAGIISGILFYRNARALHQACISGNNQERLRTMQTFKGETPLPDFDDLEELVAESTRTVTASTVEDLDDLDALLEESTALAGAKRAQKQGRKLTAEQADLLESNRLAEQMQVWEGVEAIAHFIHTTCSCGHEFRRFNSWYKLLEHRRQDSRRLVRCDDHEGLPASQHITQEAVGYCHECLGNVGLPAADWGEHPMLASLGKSFTQDSGQMELELLAGEAQGDAMLEELVNFDLRRTGEISTETFEAIDRTNNPEEFSHEPV
jgi:hypothetical protein